MIHDRDLNKQQPSDQTRALRAYINDAVTLLNNETQTESALIYLGNPHIAVPEQLLTRCDLDSDEKIIWMLLRNAIHQTGRPAIAPTQADLAHQINRSRQTVNEKIRVLRMLRFISVCARIQSNSGPSFRPVYAIHDAPLPLADTVYLDEAYLAFVQSQQTSRSSNKRLADVADNVTQNVNRLIDTTDVSTSPSPLLHAVANIPPITVRHDKNGKRTHDALTTQRSSANSDSADGARDIAASHSVGLSDTGGKKRVIAVKHSVGLSDTVCSSSYTTTTNTHTETVSHPSGLNFPSGMSPREITFAKSILHRLPDAGDQQYALDYLRDRLADTASGPVRNTLSYLNTLINLINTGQLKPSSYGLKPQKTVTRAVEETPEQSKQRWAERMREYGVDTNPLVQSAIAMGTTKT